jgi:solute carrier family 26 (sodium-independent sulfate anion transporter), member 11
MASTSTKVGHGLAKVLGIKLENEVRQDKVTRGESVFSVASADEYIENDPNVVDWIREQTPSGRDVLHYVKSLFPFLHWITRYNLQWLYGDLVAGKSPSGMLPFYLFTISQVLLSEP